MASAIGKRRNKVTSSGNRHTISSDMGRGMLAAHAYRASPSDDRDFSDKSFGRNRNDEPTRDSKPHFMER